MPASSRKTSFWRTYAKPYANQTDVEVDEELDLDNILDDGYELVLYNDDHNTFDFVIITLIELCEHDEQQATQCALEVHFKGKCGVKHGAESEMLALSREMNRRGLSSVVE